MADNNVVNWRVKSRHDIEENWNKDTTIPYSGEIIIYDSDTTHTFPRIKIGDGTTTVNNLPFIVDNSSLYGNSAKDSIAILGTEVSGTSINISPIQHNVLVFLVSRNLCRLYTQWTKYSNSTQEAYHDITNLLYKSNGQWAFSASRTSNSNPSDVLKIQYVKDNQITDLAVVFDNTSNTTSNTVIFSNKDLTNGVIRIYTNRPAGFDDTTFMLCEKSFYDKHPQPVNYYNTDMSGVSLTVNSDGKEILFEDSIPIYPNKRVLNCKNNISFSYFVETMAMESSVVMVVEYNADINDVLDEKANIKDLPRSNKNYTTNLFNITDIADSCLTKGTEQSTEHSYDDDIRQKLTPRDSLENIETAALLGFKAVYGTAKVIHNATPGAKYEWNLVMAPYSKVMVSRGDDVWYYPAPFLIRQENTYMEGAKGKFMYELEYDDSAENKANSSRTTPCLSDYHHQLLTTTYYSTEGDRLPTSSAEDWWKYIGYYPELLDIGNYLAALKTHDMFAYINIDDIAITPSAFDYLVYAIESTGMKDKTILEVTSSNTDLLDTIFSSKLSNLQIMLAGNLNSTKQNRILNISDLNKVLYDYADYNVGLTGVPSNDAQNNGFFEIIRNNNLPLCRIMKNNEALANRKYYLSQGYTMIINRSPVFDVPCKTFRFKFKKINGNVKITDFYDREVYEVDYATQPQLRNELVYDYFGIRNIIYNHPTLGRQFVFLGSWLDNLPYNLSISSSNLNFYYNKKDALYIYGDVSGDIEFDFAITIGQDTNQIINTLPKYIGEVIE